MAFTLEELLTPQTQKQLDAEATVDLSQAGYPVTDWTPGGIERTLEKLFTRMVSDHSANGIPIYTAGGFLNLASLPWLKLLAQELYNVQARDATRTTGIMPLSCSAGAGAYTIAAGQLWARADSGNRYTNTTGGTLRAPGFSTPIHTGPGTGTVTVTATFAPNDVNPPPEGQGKSISIVIATSGGLGVGEFRWSSDGGTTYSNPVTIPGGGSYAESETGITVIFAGTFTAGDTYAFDAYGKLYLTWESEFPNDSANGRNYIDVPESIKTLQTPLPGVSVNNPAGKFSSVAHDGGGTGIVRPSGTPSSAHAVIVRIDSAGQVGAAAWSTSLDGANFVSHGTASSASIGDGITITLADGAGTPSFVSGDTYLIVSPGSWITSQGTDAETRESIIARSTNRWPDLSLVPSEGVYELMARNASTQVTNVYVAPHPILNQTVLVYLAGQAGLLDPQVIIEASSYIKARVPLTDTPVVGSPNTRPIVLTGFTVTVILAYLAKAQAAIQAAYQSYLTGRGMNPLLRMFQLLDIVTDTEGIVDIDITTPRINGQPDFVQLPVTPGAIELATWTQNVVTDFTWRTV